MVGVPLTADDVVFTYEQIVFNLEISDIRDYVTMVLVGLFLKSESLMTAELNLSCEPLLLSLQLLATREMQLLSYRSTLYKNL